jgi:hypothetical protein
MLPFYDALESYEEGQDVLKGSTSFESFVCWNTEIARMPPVNRVNTELHKSMKTRKINCEEPG